MSEEDEEYKEDYDGNNYILAVRTLRNYPQASRNQTWPLNPADEIKELKEKRGALESQLVVGTSEAEQIAIRRNIDTIGQEITSPGKEPHGTTKGSQLTFSWRNGNREVSLPDWQLERKGPIAW